MVFYEELVLTAVLSVTALQCAGVRRQMSTGNSTDMRNIPVNTDQYLVRAQDSVIPANEQFFYRFLHLPSTEAVSVQPNAHPRM